MMIYKYECLLSVFCYVIHKVMFLGNLGTCHLGYKVTFHIMYICATNALEGVWNRV